MQLNKEIFLIPACIILLDALITCCFMMLNPFIDWEDFPCYLFIYPMIIYIIAIMIYAILLIVIKKVRKISIVLGMFYVNIILVFVIYFMLLSVPGLRLMHICKFQLFKAEGKQYLLLIEQHPGKTRPNDQYFIFTIDHFGWQHNSWYEVRNGPCITKGKFKVINDTLVQLYNNSWSMAIIGHLILPQPAWNKNGITDTFAGRYICGFPSMGDTARLYSNSYGAIGDYP